MKNRAAFSVALFVEVVFLFSMCCLCIYYLYFELTIPNIETLSVMVRLTLIIAIVVIPTESILLRFHFNKHKDISTDIAILARKKKIHRFLHMIQLVFVGFWFAHGIVFSLVVEGRMNLQRGTDMYMFLGKPGNIIILSSLIGVTISDFILNGINTNIRE